MLSSKRDSKHKTPKANNERTMKLSILIPLYNKEKYVDRCLKSLLAQGLPATDFEIVIVDDGSKDSGPEIVKGYANEHANIRLIVQENAGPSAARNRCLEASSGDYLYFLDADDYLAHKVFKPLLDLCVANELEIIEFNTQETTNEAATDTVSKSGAIETVEVVDGMAYMAAHGFRNEAWRYFVKKSLLTDTGTKFIEGTLYEDAIFTASLFLKASRMAKVEMDAHRYVVVENSIVTSKDKAHNLKFVNGMVYAIEHFQGLIKGLDTSHKDAPKVVKQIKGRQQAFVFALIIRTLKYRPLNFKELKVILGKLNKLGSYPMDTKIGGIEELKTSRIYKMFVPIFNNKTLLYLGMGLMRLLPSR